MDPLIRHFESRDVEGINAVIKSVFDEYGWLWDPETENRDTYAVEENYHEKGGGFWVLEDSGQVIGTVGLRDKGDGLCGLYRVYLLKSQRGRGFGRMLFQFAVSKALEMGFDRMEIWSDKTLDVSHIMYKNAGAELIGDRSVFDPDYGVPYDEWGYLLDLTRVASAKS